MKNTTPSTRSVLLLSAITAFLLLIPYAAMQFTDEVLWTASDFVIAGAMLFSAGLAFLFLKETRHNTEYRIASAMLVGSALFLTLANLAVGIIGSENNAVNLLYFGVIAVGIFGAALSRLRSAGMALTLFAMAFAQLLIAVSALLTGMQHLPGSSITEILAVNGFFITLFILSGLLFMHADTAGERNSELKTQ